MWKCLSHDERLHSFLCRHDDYPYQVSNLGIHSIFVHCSLCSHDYFDTLDASTSRRSQDLKYQCASISYPKGSKETGPHRTTRDKGSVWLPKTIALGFWNADHALERPKVRPF